MIPNALWNKFWILSWNITSVEAQFLADWWNLIHKAFNGIYQNQLHVCFMNLNRITVALILPEDSEPVFLLLRGYFPTNAQRDISR